MPRLRPPYLKEHRVYMLLYIALSIYAVLGRYALMVTNDDWALWAMLKAEGVYGTLIMSYPLSFVLSKLYDLFPSLPWYSMLFASVIGVNFYVTARYIATVRHIGLKITLLVFSLLWLGYLWLNLSVTTLTVATVVTAVGLIRTHTVWSLVWLGLAFLLRSNIMLILLPYYAAAYLVLRERLMPTRRVWVASVMLAGMITASFYLQSLDRPYKEWFAFNKARSALADMGVMKGPREQFSAQQWLLIQLSWWQEENVLPSDTLIQATPSTADILRAAVKRITPAELQAKILHHKFRYWIWLLLGATLLFAVVERRIRPTLGLLLFAVGVIWLLFTRDVERVTVALFVMWGVVVFWAFARHKRLQLLIGALFAGIFYMYASGQFGYRYFHEIQALKQEAKALLRRSGKVCEVSINMPTDFSFDLNTIFTYNFPFNEDAWMRVTSSTILPTGWLSRHPFYYRLHRLSDRYHTRRFATYHDYLVDPGTAFFGSKVLVRNELFRRLLALYDATYLKEKPGCRHRARLIDSSQHFGISQIVVDCNGSVGDTHEMFPPRRKEQP